MKGGVMGAVAQPKPAPASAPAYRPLVAVEPRRRRRKLHLFTYVVGNAVAWLLWAALSVSADRWYWWAAVPLAGWTVVLVSHLRHARHRV
jgi:hypothetical protein